MEFFDVSNPSKVITILNDDKSFVHLSDGTMIKKDKFNSKYQPVLANNTVKVNETVNTQQAVSSNDIIDPASFFSTSAVANIGEQVKKTDTTNLTDNVPQAEVKRNGVPTQQNQHSTPNNDIVRQDTKMAEIEELFENEKFAYGEAEATKRRFGRIAEHQGIGQPKQQTEVSANGVQQDTTTQQVAQPPQQQIDPSEMMFKSFKRNFEIDINVNFKEKIANPDFVKMMMDNMEGDIVGFYKKLIMNNIMKDVKKIEDEVSRSIKIAIYGEDYIEPVVEEITDVVDTKTVEKTIVDTPTLIEGKLTKSGKQTYKYVDGDDKVKELLPESAKKKGYKPYVSTDKSE